MGKLEPFDGKATKWNGLWYHKHNYCFTSVTFDLADLKKFKGKVRIVVRKNRFFEGGKNGRPNYVFMIVDSKNKEFSNFEVIDYDDDEDEGNEQVEEGNWGPVYDQFYPGVVIGYKCSECGCSAEMKFRYCPMCGAEMD